MRIVSWNLGAAYGPYVERHDEAWRWLEALDPHVALLQETIPPAWASERWTVVHRPFQHWCSAVLARPSLGLRELQLPAGSLLDRFGAYLATAVLDDLVIASVHTRAKEAPEWVTAGHDRAAMARPGEEDPWSNDVAFAGYRDLAGGRRFLVGGDWNTGRYARLDGSIAPRNAAFFARADSAGWAELSVDQDGREGRSWFGGDPRRPYQPDHVFADRTTAGLRRQAMIDPRPAELGLSDHAPIVLDVDMEVSPSERAEVHRQRRWLPAAFNWFRRRMTPRRWAWHVGTNPGHVSPRRNDLSVWR